MILSDPRFRPWLEQKLGATLPADAVFIGRMSEGKIVAAVAFSHYSGHDIHISLTVERAGRSKGLMAVVFGYVFDFCGCTRATAIIRTSNKASIALAERLGFRKEGTLRKYYGEDDALVYGVLKDECAHYGYASQAPESPRSRDHHRAPEPVQP